MVSLSLVDISSSLATMSVGALDPVAEAVVPSGWVGGARLTVALGNAAVDAGAGSPC